MTSAPRGNAPLPLADQRVALSGKFAALSQRELARLVERLGGSWMARTGRRTTLLVRGQERFARDNGPRLDRNLAHAKRLRAAGQRLEIVEEAEFLERLGVGGLPDARTCFTLVELASLLKIPGRRLRTWLRWDLIQPADTRHGIALFEFRHVANAKRMAELVLSGMQIGRLRTSLSQFRRWGPGIEPTQASRVDGGWPLVVRLPSGQLVEASGQLRLDFGDCEFRATEPDRNYLVLPGQPTAPHKGHSALPTQPPADVWLEQGLEHETRHNFAAAELAYRAALDAEPTEPALHFNLGNVLFHQGASEQAAACFRKAVHHDARYVTAWNNLGVVLAELEDESGAIFALRRAVALAPGYSDAHYNLADMLDSVGRQSEADRHWHTYLRLEPHGEGASYVRRRLAEVK